jgi:lipid-binding SYLF domain-containing protein
MRHIVSACMLACVALGVTAYAAVTASEKARIEDAATVLEQLHQTPDHDIPQNLWEDASCVAVIPSVKKAAFILGGEYGKGLMSCRKNGAWTAPAFIELEKGSIGFQIGGESVDLVLLVMNDKGVNHLLQDKVALGAEASVAGGPVGRDARAMTDAQLQAEILSYSRSQGLFAGVNLTGGVLHPDEEANADLYGASTTPRQILVDGQVTKPAAAEPFLTALTRHSAPAPSQE